MADGFDFGTPEVLDWEIEAIWAAVDDGSLLFSHHARTELTLDALTEDDVVDALSFPDETSKDLPGNALGRAPGINFDRYLERVTVRVKVGWKLSYYVVITVMAN